MIVRNCAGGVVFFKDKVFLKNDKNEWVLPKGKIRNGELVVEAAIRSVTDETGLDVEIISTAGETNYEFYSFSRQKPVCNVITWFIMESKNNNYLINKDKGFIDGGLFDIEKAIDLITYSQDESLVRLALKKYLKIIKEDLVIA